MLGAMHDAAPIAPCGKCLAQWGGGLFCLSLSLSLSLSLTQTLTLTLTLTRRPLLRGGLPLHRHYGQPPYTPPLRICSEGGADGAGERCRDAVGSDLAPLRPGHPPRRGHACGLIIYSENATAPFVWEVGERDDREGEEAGRRAPSR